jgi:2-(1,2-epoxy-1,2-dihydrophenyl)acetyl-CoA isomerase
MDSPRLCVEIRDGVGRINLNRSAAANAIDLAFAREFEAAAAECLAHRVRVVLITAEGRQFCAGGDLKSFNPQPDLPTHLMEVTSHLHAGIATFVEMDAPVVVAVQGAVAGAGIGLICAADVAIAAESATFVMAYTALGLSPDGSSSWFLARHIGLRRALDFTITNRVLGADEALAWGLVSRVVRDEQVMSEAEGLIAQLVVGSTAAYGASSRLLRAAANNSLRSHLAAETTSIVERARSADGIEGLRAFAERRNPAFSQADPSKADSFE